MTETDKEPKFRLRIKPLRKERGWSQMDLAARARSHPAEISRIEHGVRSPGADLLSRLAAAFDMPVGELFEPTEPPTEPPEAGPPAPRGFRAGDVERQPEMSPEELAQAAMANASKMAAEALAAREAWLEDLAERLREARVVLAELEASDQVGDKREERVRDAARKVEEAEAQVNAELRQSA
jgi:transcriptional regulator with XRE-family HTH domain